MAAWGFSQPPSGILRGQRQRSPSTPLARTQTDPAAFLHPVGTSYCSLCSTRHFCRDPALIFLTRSQQALACSPESFLPRLDWPSSFSLYSTGRVLQPPDPPSSPHWTLYDGPMFYLHWVTPNCTECSRWDPRKRHSCSRPWAGHVQSSSSPGCWWLFLCHQHTLMVHLHSAVHQDVTSRDATPGSQAPPSPCLSGGSWTPTRLSLCPCAALPGSSWPPASRTTAAPSSGAQAVPPA